MGRIRGPRRRIECRTYKKCIGDRQKGKAGHLPIAPSRWNNATHLEPRCSCGVKNLAVDDGCTRGHLLRARAIGIAVDWLGDLVLTKYSLLCAHGITVDVVRI